MWERDSSASHIPACEKEEKACSFLPHECWWIRLVPAQLFPSALINEIGFALLLVGPERLFKAPSQLANYTQFMLSLPPPAHLKSRVPSPPRVTPEGCKISLSRQS